VIVAPDGSRWGTAAEIAAHLGHGVTEAVVRSWVRRDGLPAARMADDDGRPQVRYPFVHAARIDARKRHGQRGRPRAA
jgi:hypothetical protein